jgi:hypothetical protein
LNVVQKTEFNIQDVQIAKEISFTRKPLLRHQEPDVIRATQIPVAVTGFTTNDTQNFPPNSKQAGQGMKEIDNPLQRIGENDRDRESTR